MVATTICNGLLTTEPKQLLTNDSLKDVISYVMVVPADRSITVYVSNFFRIAVRLSKPTAIFLTTQPPPVIHAINTEPRRRIRSGVPEKDSQTHPIPEKDTTSGIPIADNFFAVHYKPPKNREPQMTRNRVVKIDDSNGVLEEWHTEVHVSEKYTQYREEFLSLLFEF